MTDPDAARREPESTLRLLERIRQGDAGAREALVQRYLDALQRWAHGRLPAYARGEMNTQDLVQDTLVRALERMDGFRAGETGSFLAYLRQILKNRIRDEIRTVRRRPATEVLDESIEGETASPLELAIGSQTWARYEAALARLPAEQREGVIMRFELQFTHEQVAQALGMASANAARMMVSRAVVRLAGLMEGEDESG